MSTEKELEGVTFVNYIKRDTNVSKMSSAIRFYNQQKLC